MRRRVITDTQEILEVIRACQWCHLGMADLEGNPYVLPMNFGFQENTVFLHGSSHGKKIEILGQNPRVCINFSTDHKLRYQSEQVACSWSMSYRSILVYGRVIFIPETDKKMEALDIIMKQYSDRRFRYNPPSLREVNVWKVPIEKIEGRAFGL
jgi:nitroimidazol reductase NimA-like FMN-containing flavoprotein (pyridoxamine 5'-phosphate oxidase superfamily)